MQHDKSVESLVDQMSLEEQVSLLSGEDLWSLPAIPRLGINKLRVTDGPNGARGSGTYINATTAAAFPAAISLGATWNTELAQQVGQAIAQEVKSKCAHVSLAPTVNIHRTATNGRNFECFSEDPELTAALATAYIKGQQSEGVASTIKHFVGNESEFERTTINSVIDERTLRELYLRPFEDAVKKAGVWAVMSSYNKLNGCYTAENRWLLSETLRKDWGFDGVVMSDWYGSRSTAPTINAGLDLEMPGPTRDRGAKLLAAVADGEVSRDTVRASAMAILTLMKRVGSIDDEQPFVERSDDLESHRALIRKAGAEATVLLKNQDNKLPLDLNNCGTVAVIGPNAKVAQIMGGGSAQLTPHYRISPWDGLVTKLGEQRLVFAEGCSNYRWEPLHQGKTTVAFYDNKHWAGEPVYQEVLDSAIAFWDIDFADNKVSKFNFSARINTSFDAPNTGIYNLGFHCAGYAKVYLDGKLVLDATSQWLKGRTFFEEGCDEIVVQLALEAGKSYDIDILFCNRQPDNIMVSGWRLGISQPLGSEGIQQAANAARNADTAIVFIGRSGEWDTEGSDLEDISLPGRQNELVEAVLEANPNTIVVLQTGGPVELPWLESVPAVLQAWYPGQECGNAIADVLFGDQEPTGRLPQTFPRCWSDNPTHTNSPLNYPGIDGQVEYGEGLDIGYRHYDKHQIKPLFPFGYGLSYTRFQLSDLVVNVSDQNRVDVAVTIENTGQREGATVVQLYTSELAPALDRPSKELKTFAKPIIASGERTTLNFTLGLRDFAYCDVEQGGWRIDAGKFMVSVGFNAEQISASAIINLKDDFQGY
ncbi:glycoside hydrolase family 3 C-terminal domain-containing protein [Neiella marina]|uniref:Glycoside hydrolase family 3 C-terminal domain-containing protein n=1 Tax=Neiella holothuriorum TaxID=2870530 RepID=A0ABS7EKS6_9GAMM|nr:glycoside hydrolase family 3 C-terminal domain-containing protein [Neiella holothuriorum]MBW8192473.1 glycoside hydrolase family 3 C-terminal domain-containing protein [Neiella holothuriorum]